MEKMGKNNLKKQCIETNNKVAHFAQTLHFFFAYCVNLNVETGL